MNQNYTESQEIDLKEMCLTVLLKWRNIFITAIIIAIMTAAFFFISYQRISDENMEEAKNEFTYEYDAYFAQIDTLETQIANMQENKDRQTEYIEDSLKMNLDPLNLYVATAQFYVNTDYKIMPDKVYQNIDTSVMVLNGYANYLNNGSMYQDILDRLSYKTELRYLKEIVNATTDIGSRMIEITVNQSSAELCKELMTIIAGLLKEKQVELEKNIDAHQLIEVDEAFFTTVDFDLETYQKENIQYVSDLMTSIQENSEKLTELKKKPVPEFKYNTVEIVKDIIKKGVIGGIIGFFIACIYFAAAFVLSGKVMTVDELKQIGKQHVLVQYKAVYKSKIDCFIRRQFGLIEESLTEEERTKLTYETIQTACYSCGIKEDAVLLVTSSNSEEAAKVIEGLSSYSSIQPIKLIPGKNVETDLETVRLLNEYNTIVIIEECKVSTRQAIENEISLMNRFNKNILGSVIINV